jgi:hypothetical protein
MCRKEWFLFLVLKIGMDFMWIYKCKISFFKEELNIYFLFLKEILKGIFIDVRWTPNTLQFFFKCFIWPQCWYRCWKTINNNMKDFNIVNMGISFNSCWWALFAIFVVVDIDGHVQSSTRLLMKLVIVINIQKNVIWNR